MRALDNTRRNPITSLTVSAQTAVGADSPAGCVVEFIGRTTGSAAAKQNITLRVDGENQITKPETFAAVEEQIERTFISPWPIVAVALSLIAVLLLALFVLGGFRLQVIPTRLSSADLLQLVNWLQMRRTQTINLLFYLMRSVVKFIRWYLCINPFPSNH